MPCICVPKTESRSPTGDYCRVCGFSWPGYECPHCGRTYVHGEHLTPDHQPCEITEAEERSQEPMI